MLSDLTIRSISACASERNSELRRRNLCPEKKKKQASKVENYSAARPFLYKKGEKMPKKDEKTLIHPFSAFFHP